MEHVLESRQCGECSVLASLSLSLLLSLVGEPLPEVAQEQGESHEEQSIEWIARGGTGAGLVQLAITGFDAKAEAISRVAAVR